ncbi:hypothetical protein AF335_14835 [Streptomyces eurocidicus]|uniref:DNA-binding LytR/AlgR family response regulator n=1 Tax=Streptomyces eurocidicus TaxID=66423 RepID=A0A2N8NVL8_STREU|nr:hypothetical protein [Streptomyces eurocidicus]MBB5122297.1 DNA-binding LytR/AlgR family response regulator [Streptomyces eurocidicus]PNE32811.1 hypothetical protein AF335_14835 [Streptomyces eurocidicus]
MLNSSGGGAGTLVAAVPAARRASLDHTLHVVFATAHNTLALTAGAVAPAGVVLVLILTRRTARQAPAADEQSRTEPRATHSPTAS